MFDNLHKHFITFDIPITQENYTFLINRHYHIKPDDCWSPQDSILTCNYCFDGQSFSCPPFPVTDYAKNHFYHIKAFAIIHAEKQYFTKRENEDSFLFLFTYDGKGLLEYNGKKHYLSKGDGFLIDCRLPHFYKTIGSHWSHAVLHFNGSESETFYRIFQEQSDGIFSLPTNGLFQKQFEELIELYDSVTMYRELLISSKLNTLLTTLLTTSSFYKDSVQAMPENLNYLVKYIQNFYNRHLSLDFLAEFSGISKPHLIRLFNKYLSCTPKEYIIQLQIEHAKNLLETTTIPASKIGCMVGIENSSYFGHLFKTRTGMSPGEFRTARNSSR